MFAKISLLVCLGSFLVSSVLCRAGLQPNIVILFADDLGYGDLATYGHPTSRSNNLDHLARDGLLFTQFYSAAPVCSPSRASLLTGRLPVRNGVWPGVFEPNSSGGLATNETTLAKVLKQEGYNTAMVGKWHLGIGKNKEYLPTNFGFDSWLGIPYSHDMCPCAVCFPPDHHCLKNCSDQYTACPLMENDHILQQPADLLTLSQTYVSAAQGFMESSAGNQKPFFLYYAFQHTHHPQFANKAFHNSSLRGSFGDSLAELDWCVGQVMGKLGDLGLLNNTLVFFTSDNGPSLTNENRGGDAGTLKCGKGTTYEGGQRVPAIAYWPGQIKPNRTMELASTLDLLPTIAKLAGAQLPSATLDGYDLHDLLFEQGKSPRQTFFYLPTAPDPKYGIYAVRHKQYKAHYYTQGEVNSDIHNRDLDCRPTATRTRHDPPLLFDLNQDPGERYNLNADKSYDAVLKEIDQVKAEFEKSLVWAESEVNKPNDNAIEPCCKPGCLDFPSCCVCAAANNWWGRNNQ